MDEFDALAQEFGGAAAPAGGQDFDALAAETGGQVAAPTPAPPPPRRMAPNEFEFEVEQALRRGEDPAQVQAQFGGVINARTGGPITFPKPEELTAAADYYRRGGAEGLQWNREILGPDGTPSTNVGSYARGIADEATLKFADDIEAFVETGSFYGKEFDAALVRRQQRRMADNPDFRAGGQFVGTGLTMAYPGAPLFRVKGLLPQMGVAAGVGGGMTALSGVGAAAPGERTDNLIGDFIFGAGAGALAPVVAGTGRKLVQMFGPGDAINQTAANDILQGAGLDPAGLRRRAEAYFQATGQGARITDLLTPDEAKRFTGPLSRSEAARDRVMGELETARITLPTAMQGGVAEGPTGPREIRGPESIRQATRARGDREFEAFRDTPVELTDADVQFMADTVIPNAPVSRIVDARVAEPLRTRAAAANELQALATKIESGNAARARMTPTELQNTLDRIMELEARLDDPVEVVAGDLDIYRRSLGKRARAKPGEGYKEAKEDLEDLIANQIPAAQKAIENYARGMQVAEGAEFGRTALASRGAVDFPEQFRGLTEPGREGAALGARSGLFEQAVESPGQSYALARRLEQDPGFQARLRQALPPGEADALIAFATQQKQGVDALASMAQIPQDKIETLLDSTEEMTDAVVAAGLGAGGAFKAGILNSILERTNIGRGAANKLAENLLNPARRERVIELLEKAGLPKLGLREIVQSAFIATGVAISTADREPEGIPVPQETVTMGVPQQ
jgi:hypothetical protein